MKNAFFCLIGLLFFTSVAQSQKIITPDSYQSYVWDFERMSEEDSSALMLHYSIKEPGKSAFSLTDPIAKVSYNTAYPRGYNDGAVWKGKGLNTEIHAGFSGTTGILSYTFQPVLYYNENKSFSLAPNLSSSINPFNYQFVNFEESWSIDYVQRPGTNSNVVFHPGQSEIKLNLGLFAPSLTTQNYIFGPSVTNPIILSNNAPGVPKLNLGTNGPIKFNIGERYLGKIEASIIYSFLRESEYFDVDDTNDWSYLNGMFISVSPAFAPNLSIGVSRVLYKQLRFWEQSDLYSFIKVKEDPVKIINGDTITSTNDFFDQVASFTMEWKFPSVGFRTYLEFAVNDFHGNSRWELLEPEHSRAYTLGFQKIFNTSPFFSIITTYEHTNLSINHTYLYRATPPFYVHQYNKQGYTNQGQIMGAGIGPGSNSDYLEAKAKLHQSGTVFGISLQRIEFNKDYFITHSPSTQNHNVEYTWGANCYVTSGDLVYGLNATYSHNYNQYYEIKNDIRNVYLAFSANYLFSN